jgi:two-component system, OmpR family, alkaline phosphatase synthesis response regulator PhoP
MAATLAALPWRPYSKQRRIDSPWLVCYNPSRVKARTIGKERAVMAKVLVVDDDPDFVKVTCKVLEKAGYEVASAANGAKALQAMRKDPPDVVLLDIMMSYVLDGLDVSREMTADPVLKDIPIIMVTSLTGVKGTGAFPTDEYIPVDEWLTKPVDPKTLVARVNRALA